MSYEELPLREAATRFNISLAALRERIKTGLSMGGEQYPFPARKVEGLGWMIDVEDEVWLQYVEFYHLQNAVKYRLKKAKELQEYDGPIAEPVVAFLKAHSELAEIITNWVEQTLQRKMNTIERINLNSELGWTPIPGKWTMSIYFRDGKRFQREIDAGK